MPVMLAGMPITDSLARTVVPVIPQAAGAMQPSTTTILPSRLWENIQILSVQSATGMVDMLAHPASVLHVMKINITDKMGPIAQLVILRKDGEIKL